MSKVHPDASENGGSGDGEDDGDDDFSIPSVSSASEESDDESAGSEAVEEAGEDKATWGDQRANAAAEEKAKMVQAWRKNPKPKEFVEESDYRYPCYRCRWFLGCCIRSVGKAPLKNQSLSPAARAPLHAPASLQTSSDPPLVCMFCHPNSLLS